MFPLLAPLVLLANCMSVQAHENLISMHPTRSITNSSPKHCNRKCAPFRALRSECQAQSCGCNTRYLQAQGDCLVCKSQIPQEAAAVQLLLEAEIDKCHDDGISIAFKYKFPPDEQAIVDGIERKSAHLRQQQTAFLTLQILGGQVGLVLAVGFATFSRKVSRDPTFLNFCLTWIFSSIVYSILLYGGTEGNTIASSLGRVLPGICLAQAALTNGAQVMTASSTMALVVQLWIKLSEAVQGNRVRDTVISKQSTTIMLLGLPYILFLASAIPSVFIGRIQITVDGTSVQRALPANFYCSVIEVSTFLRLIYAVTFGLLMVAAVFDILIIFILYRHWCDFRHIQNSNAVTLSTLSRIIGFSLYRVVVAIAYGVVLDRPPHLMPQVGSGVTQSVSLGVPIWVDMLQATIPLVGFLVLGVNSDMLNSPVTLWRRSKRTFSTNLKQLIDTNIDYHNDKAFHKTDTTYMATQV